VTRTRAGLATLPFAIVTGAASPLAITLMKRAGTKAVVAAGLALMSGGFLIAATTAIDTAYWGKLIIAMTLMAAGLALTASPATDAIMGALPPAKAGAGSAVNDTTREVGGTLGVAILGSVLNSAYGHHVQTALAGLGAPHAVASAAGKSIEAGLVTAGHFPAALQPAAATAVKQAFVTGLHQGSLAAAGATAAAALVALAFLPARPGAADDHSERSVASPVSQPGLATAGRAGQ
jgi:MFS family permease